MDVEELDAIGAANDRLYLASLIAAGVHAPKELGREYRALKSRAIALSQPLLPPRDEALDQARALAARVEASGAFADLEPAAEGP